MVESQSELAEKRRGRPSKGKRGTFTFRVTGTMRAKLEAEAELAQRPVSEIIESRLEHSFDFDAFMNGPETGTLIALIAAAIASQELIHGDRWFRNANIAAACRKAVSNTLSLLMSDVPKSQGKSETLEDLQKRSALLKTKKKQIDQEFPEISSLSDAAREEHRLRLLQGLRQAIPRYASMSEDEIVKDLRDHEA